MGKYRDRRRKLKEHDAGRNRHNRNLAWMQKRTRLANDRARRLNKQGLSSPASGHDA